MSAQNPPNHGDEHDHSASPVAGEHADALAGNPYASHYQQRAEEPDLDAGAPQLRASELRRMNHRALLLLGAVVLLLLFVAYWMIQSATASRDKPKPREEKVTVAEAPAAVAFLPEAMASAPVAPSLASLPPPVELTL